MSKPVASDLFKFSGRRNRKSYLYFLLAAIAVQIVISVIMGAAGGLGGEEMSVGMLIVAVPVFIVITVMALAVGSQRCRDFGWTGWAMLLMLVPFIGPIFALAIIFIPGTQGENRYGPDPLQQYA
jgi:uncharacterized membrane protein YhaH (DUF805 family)